MSLHAPSGSDHVFCYALILGVIVLVYFFNHQRSFNFHRHSERQIVKAYIINVPNRVNKKSNIFLLESKCIHVGWTAAVYHKMASRRRALNSNWGWEAPLCNGELAWIFCTLHRIFILSDMASCLTDRIFFGRDGRPFYLLFGTNLRVIWPFLIVMFSL